MDRVKACMWQKLRKDNMASDTAERASNRYTFPVRQVIEQMTLQEPLQFETIWHALEIKYLQFIGKKGIQMIPQCELHFLFSS